MADIGNLIVKIGADASGLQKAFGDLAGSAQQFQRGLSHIGSIASTAFFAATTAIVAMTIAAGKQGEELDQLAGITGINTDALQEYEVMLNRAGLGMDDLARVMKTLSMSMDQAKQGTGTAGDRFRQLGIDITKVTSTDDLIRKVATAASQFADGASKAAVMTDLLGKGWQTFIRAFQGGAAAFDEAKKASQDLGQTLSTLQLAVLAKMDNQVDDLMLSFKRFGQQLGVTFAPNIEYIAKLLKEMLAAASHWADGLALALDTAGVRLSHFAIKMSELKDLVFSTNIFSGEAWQKMLGNWAFIDKEADKQVAKLKAAAAVLHAPAAKDTRKAMPDFVDTAKQSTQQQALIDAQLKSSEGLFKDQEAMAKAGLANRLAILDAAKAAGIRTEEEVAIAHAQAEAQMAAFTEESLKRQLENYRTFTAAKEALFTSDTTGQADKAKFLEEAARKETDLINQIALARINADTQRIQSDAAILASTKSTRLIPLQDEIDLARAAFALQQGFYQAAPALAESAAMAREKAFALLELEVEMRQRVIDQTIKDEQRRSMAILALDYDTSEKRMAIIQQFPTFWEQQMQSLVDSNAFSISQITTTWTSGLANAIVTGTDFVKEAWRATQVAIVQGVLNTGIQLAAQWALAHSVEVGLLTAAEAAKLGLKTTADAVLIAENEAKNAALVAGDAVAAGATVSIWAGASAAILAMLTGVGAAITAFFTLTVLPMIQAVVAWVVGVMSAIAELMFDTVFGIPIAIALIAGIALLIAAASGGLKFKEGGIGDFGSGTPAMLHGPEAIIPLNSRGANFFKEVFGSAPSSPIIHTHVMLNGREIARAVSDDLPGALRTMGAF